MNKLKEIIDKYNCSYFENVYLFTGDKYLIDIYLKKIKEMCTNNEDDTLNTSIYKGKIDIKEVIDQALTVPFMASRRVVIVKNSDIFTTKHKEMTEYLKKNMSTIPSSSMIIFIEDEVDGRSALTKQFKKNNLICDFRVTQQQLTEWVIQQATIAGKDIKRDTALFFVKYVRGDMLNMQNELNKVFGFSDIITEDSIRELCIQSLEVVIFTLITQIASKKVSAALQTYKQLLEIKEPAYKIFALIERQIRLLLITKQGIDESMSLSEIGKAAGVMDFVVKDLISQAQLFSLEELLHLYYRCEEIDYEVKSGKKDIELSLELFMVEI